MSLNQVNGVCQLKKKIAGQCPCGYFFETLSSETVAVAMIQSHVESFHKDFLPFGITNEEAQMLLKVEYMEEERKQRIATGTFYSSKTKRVPSSISTSSSASRKPKRKRIQLMEHFS
jgi:hypothetical protein